MQIWYSPRALKLKAEKMDTISQETTKDIQTVYHQVISEVMTIATYHLLRS